MLITQMTSAFWHGFYPAYYLTFLNVHFLIDIARAVYRSRHIKIFKYLPTGRWRALIVNRFGQGIFSFHLVSFCVLQPDKVWQLTKNYYFLPYVWNILLYVFIAKMDILKFCRPPKALKEKKKKNE